MFLGCKGHKSAEEDTPDHLFLPVTEQVYEQLMMNPSAATRYFESVQAYEQHMTDVPVPIVASPTVTVAPDPESTPAPVQSFQPVEIHSVVVPLTPRMPYELKPMDAADVLIRVESAALIRRDSDPKRIPPTISIMGINKDFGLGVEFDVQLSAAQPAVTLQQTSVLSKTRLWIRNPQHGFTYGLEKQT